MWLTTGRTCITISVVLLQAETHLTEMLCYYKQDIPLKTCLYCMQKMPHKSFHYDNQDMPHRKCKYIQMHTSTSKYIHMCANTYTYIQLD